MFLTLTGVAITGSSRVIPMTDQRTAEQRFQDWLDAEPDWVQAGEVV